MKFVVDCFGCRSNQAEVQEWIIELEKLGYELTTGAGRGRLRHPEHLQRHRESRKGRAALHRPHLSQHHASSGSSPAARSASDRTLLSQKYKNYFFFDNQEKKHLVQAVRELFPLDSRMIYHSSFRSRVFLKVQDGCNFRCSYCIVPSLRGKARSLTKKDVVAKVRHYAALGYREVVLTGINLSSYGYDLFPARRPCWA